MIYKALVAIGFAVIAHAATAQTALTIGAGSFDNTQPVEVSADELTVDQQAGTAQFIGNVVVIQGDVRLSAGQIEVVYATGDSATGISRLIATGGVTLVTATEAAEATDATYSLEDGNVVMTGDVLLTQGQNALAGERLVVNLTTGEGRMEGRVRTVFGGGNGDN